MSKSVRQLVFSAVAIALAMITSNIKLMHMPMGGSVTLLSMFFITLIGYWYGIGGGLIAAVAYGLLQFVIGGYFLSLPQMLCDYPLAFGALGLSGLFRMKDRRHPISRMLPGYLLGVCGRYVFSIISGVVFFASYAADAGYESPFVYSAVYNGAYLGVEALITVVVILIPAVQKGLSQVTKLALGE